MRPRSSLQSLLSLLAALGILCIPRASNVTRFHHGAPAHATSSSRKPSLLFSHSQLSSRASVHTDFPREAFVELLRVFVSESVCISLIRIPLSRPYRLSVTHSDLIIYSGLSNVGVLCWTAVVIAEVVIIIIEMNI